MESVKIPVEEFRKILVTSLNHLESERETTDNLNVFPVPDGDTGTNMFMTFKSAVRYIEENDAKTYYEIGDNLTRGALMGARGNSGVILSQILRGLGSVFMNEHMDFDGKALVKGLEMSKEVAYKAVKNPVKGTILTVLDGLLSGAVSGNRSSNDLDQVLRSALTQGKISLKETKEMLPVLKEADVVDAGGYGLIIIFEGLYKGLLGEHIEVSTKKDVISTDVIDDAFLSSEDIVYAYCTEFIVLEPTLNDEEIRDYIEENLVGDSLVTIVSDGIAKIHMHTNDPGKLLSFAVSFGQLTNLKIENMKEQFKDKINKTKEKDITLPGNTGAKKKSGLLFVSPGKGISDIAKSMGVDEVVTGGQSFNPSTEDMVEGINKINAKVVYIFTNNKNVILAAEQCKNVINNKEIIVIPSTTIPQGINALLNFSDTLSKEENTGEMIRSFEDIKSGALTYAVRDSQSNGLEIKKDDILVMCEGKIVSTVLSYKEGILKYLEEEYDGEDLLSLYVGEGVSLSDGEELKVEILKEYGDLEIEILEGNQDVYFYLMSLE